RAALVERCLEIEVFVFPGTVFDQPADSLAGQRSAEASTKKPLDPMKARDDSHGRQHNQRPRPMENQASRRGVERVAVRTARRVAYVRRRSLTLSPSTRAATRWLVLGRGVLDPEQPLCA